MTPWYWPTSVRYQLAGISMAGQEMSVVAAKSSSAFPVFASSFL
jgi:hypothetical protein